MNIKLVEKFYNSEEYLTKIRNRMTVLQNCAKDELYASQMILNTWAVDPVEFIETFLWLKIPNYQNAIKPFFLFDYQKRIIQKLLEAENDTEEHIILIDKPREMGVTWIIIAYFYWRWLFTPNYSSFVLSRTEAEVDDGGNTPDNSIFGKIRWLMGKTPKWIMPEGFAPKGKKGTSTDSMLKLANPKLQSSINGSTTNANAGRSRRYSSTFVDECFSIDHFDEVFRALESVSRVKIYASSAKMGKRFQKFKEMCEAKGDYIHLEWKDHPWKDEEWFADIQRKAEFDPEILREAVVSYSIDKKSQYYPQIAESKVLPIEYDKTRSIYMSMDIGRGDLTVLIWWQYNGTTFNIVETYANNNKEIEWYIPFMNPEVEYAQEAYPTKHQKDLLKKIRTWQKPRGYFGELDHFKKSMASNKSCADIMAKHGVRLLYNSYAIQYEPRRKATSAILPMTVFNENSDYTMELYDAMMNSRYANVIAPTSASSVLKPVHDPETADYRAAFENGAVNIPRILKLQRTEARTEDSRNITNGLLKYLKS